MLEIGGALVTGQYDSGQLKFGALSSLPNVSASAKRYFAVRYDKTGTELCWGKK